jgi:NAD(P)-dependent dehydrogenase (short-subunit alcohol dehydrogenase family)
MKTRGRLAGKVAVVTGAGKGIGRATSRALAREGANIVIASRTKADLDQLAASLVHPVMDALEIERREIRELSLASRCSRNV